LIIVLHLFWISKIEIFYCLGSPLDVTAKYNVATFIVTFARDVVRAGIAQYSDGLDGWGSIPGKVKRFLSSLQRPDLLWGLPSLLFQWVPGALSVGVERPGLETGH
jgi:hypothetical protein